MPIKSEQQRKFMAMCLHNPEKAQGKCPPKSVAKKFIHGHSRKDETSDMNNQIDHRLALRALFEAALIQQINSGKIDEGLLGSLKRFGIGLKSGYQHLQGDKDKSFQTYMRGQQPLDAGEKRTANRQAFKDKMEAKYGMNWVQTGLKKKQERLAREKADRLARVKKAPAQATQSPAQATQAPTSDTRVNKPLRRKEFVDRHNRMEQAKDMEDDMIRGQSQNIAASTDYSRLGLRALFEAVIVESKKKSIAETKRGTARPAGGGTSTDTGGANLHPVVKKAAERLAPQGKVTRFEGDPTSPAAAKAQRTHSTAMDAALKPSEEEGLPLKNPPPATNRPGKKQAETPGGKATNPLDRPTAGKFTPRQVAAIIAAKRGKKS